MALLAWIVFQAYKPSPPSAFRRVEKYILANRPRNPDSEGSENEANPGMPEILSVAAVGVEMSSMASSSRSSPSRRVGPSGSDSGPVHSYAVSTETSSLMNSGGGNTSGYRMDAVSGSSSNSDTSALL